MKKIYFIATLFVANAITAQTSGLETIVITNSESYWDGSDLSGTSNGAGLFDTVIMSGDLEYPNQYDTTWGASWGFWSQGWAVSNQTSDTLTGLNGSHSSYAGGPKNGSNYAVGMTGSEIVVANNGVALFSDLYVTNANYTAHSMLNGDDFAKQFGSPNDVGGNPDGTNGEDWLLLTIVGYNLQGDPTDSIEFYLADYRFADSTQDYIVKDWQMISLSALGLVNKLRFKISSSDVGQWGMNTPDFFVIDDISHGTVGINNELQVNIAAYPNPVTDELRVLTNTTRGQINLYDLSGKIVMSQNIYSEITTMNLIPIISGIYNLVITSEEGRSSTKIIKL